jgi:general secretion pathway protein C
MALAWRQGLATALPHVSALKSTQEQPVVLDRSNLVQSAAVVVATVAALAILGSIAAYWTWTWFAPRPQVRAPVAADSAVGISAGGLFGIVESAGGTAAPTGLAIELLGVVAATGGRPGYAVVRLDGKEIFAVRAGDEFAPGIRIEQVFPDRVTLERGGTLETLAWPEKPATAKPMTPPINR